MEPTRVLVIDDEPQIRRAVRNALEEDGAHVIEAATGREGIDRAATARPDLVILDLGLPDSAGLSVCREIRKWSDAPIVVLSARHSDREKVELLDAGADDYMTKPFSTSELQARVRAQARRAKLGRASDSAPIRVGDLSLDLAGRVVRRGDREIHLTPIEWDLLCTLVKHAGRTVTHQQIFRDVWRNPAGNAQEYLWVHVSNLRKKIEPNPMRPELILTEPGVGYRFRALD